jgi:RNA recognition motif-containing protein
VSTTLYASNLPLAATEDNLNSRFARFGGVLSVRLERDPAGARRRSAFIEMENAAGAQRAINGLNLSTFDGRLMSVYAAVMPALSVAAKAT